MFGLWGLIGGIVLIILGGVMIFVFPSTGEYQTDDFATVGIVIGFVLAISGALLMFG